MKTEITDRMKKNGEIGRIAMLQLRAGLDISDASARFVATTVGNPDVGRDQMEADGGQDALAAVWVLDDAEQMAGSFSDLESRLLKAEKMMGRDGYVLQIAEDPKTPFVLEQQQEEGAVQCSFTLCPEFIREKQQIKVHFGVIWGAMSERSCSLTDMETAVGEIQAVTKLLKRLNGLNIRGEEKALKLAVFSCVERRRIQLARQRRQAERKQRGSR